MTEPTRLPAETTPNALSLIDKALSSGLKTEDLTVLYELHKDMERRENERNFHEALAYFQAECPPIRKNKSSKQASGAGGGFAYTYASLDEIERTVRPILTKHGLSYTWDMSLVDGAVEATCTLRGFGHEITSKFVAPIDKGGRMNDIQKHGSALTYAKRYSLESVLGTSTSDDIDAVAPETAPQATVDAKQASTIREWLDQLPKEVEDKLLGAYSVSMVSELPASAYAAIVKRLREKVEAKGG